MTLSALRSPLALAVCLTCSWLSVAAQSAPAPASASDTYKLSVQVKRVILDVVVTDASGKPVEGLKQDDFKVFEDGAVQPVRSFDVHTASAESAAQPALDLHLPPNTFSNLTLAPPDSPVTILLYDVLNTKRDNLPYAHKELVAFIKAQKGAVSGSTRIAIFALTDRLHMLQGFTDDETRLMAAIEEKSLGSHTSQLRNAETGDDVKAMLADPDGPAPEGPNGPTADNIVIQMLQQAEAEEQDLHDTDRIQTTVQAFINLSRFVSSLPGRKNLVWLAGSFPTEIWPGRTLTGASGFDIASPLQSQMREAQAILKDARVAIYPVDVRGVRADPIFAASTTPPRPPRRGSGAAPSPRLPTFGEQNAGENATIDAIADSSGGRAFYSTNDLKQAMDTAVREGSEYYSLTYAPSNGREDGGERRVKVSLDRPGYRLTYRERYLAPDSKHPAPVRPLVQDMNMQHGAPNSSELFFEAKVFPVGGAMPASAAETASMKPFLETNARIEHVKVSARAQTIQHYGVDVAIIGRALQMPQVAGGRYATNMSFGLAAYTQDGELLNGTEISVKNAIAEAQYRKIQADGYRASMMFAAPAGATSLRLGVRDELGHHIGTMEIALPVRAPSDGINAVATSK